MTASTSDQLAKLLSGVELLMLDFDGPICSVFAGLPAPIVAERLRRSLRQLGVKVTAQLENDPDPLSIYRQSASHGPVVTAALFGRLVAAEVEAVSSAAPTPGALAAIRAARASKRRIAVVSNNAADAVEAYVGQHGLAPYIDHIAARRTSEPNLMKPHPAYVIETTTVLAVAPQRSVLVGDSETDMHAIKRAGGIAIGYANKPGKHDRLSAAGADAILSQMVDLVPALLK